MILNWPCVWLGIPIPMVTVLNTHMFALETFMHVPGCGPQLSAYANYTVLGGKYCHHVQCLPSQKLATAVIDKYTEEVGVYSEGSFSIVCDCVGWPPPSLSLSHCWQTGSSPWQPRWAGFQPSGINLPFPRLWLRFQFPQGATRRTKQCLRGLWPYRSYQAANVRQGSSEQFQDTYLYRRGGKTFVITGRKGAK